MNSSNQINYIDFGLPFLVADRNIGAKTPEGFGIYVSEELLSGAGRTGMKCSVKNSVTEANQFRIPTL